MKISLLVLLLCPSWLTQAQVQLPPEGPKNHPLIYQKGMWLVGLQAGRSPAQLIGNNFTAHVYGGYFILDKLLLGLQATRIQEGLTQPVRDVSYLAGPTLRYQLTRTRISPFIVVSCQVGQRTFTLDPPVITPSSSTTVGLPTVTKISGLSVADPGSRLIYSRSAGVGVSIGVITSLRVDVALTWQDRVNALNSGSTTSEGFYQAQFGINYSLGGAHQPSRY